MNGHGRGAPGDANAKTAPDRQLAGGKVQPVQSFVSLAGCPASRKVFAYFPSSQILKEPKSLYQSGVVGQRRDGCVGVGCGRAFGVGPAECAVTEGNLAPWRFRRTLDALWRRKGARPGTPEPLAPRPRPSARRRHRRAQTLRNIRTWVYPSPPELNRSASSSLWGRGSVEGSGASSTPKRNAFMSGPWTKAEKIALIAIVAPVLTGVLVGLLVPQVGRMLGLEVPSQPFPQTAPLLHPQSATEDRSGSKPVTRSLSGPSRTDAIEGPPQTSTSGASIDARPLRPPGAETTGRGQSGTSPKVARPRADLSVEFSLQDGEQKVLLHGLASVAVDFNRVGETEFATVVINIAGSEPTRHAVLGAEARFEFRVNGRPYLLSVLKLTGGKAKMRVDRRS